MKFVPDARLMFRTSYWTKRSITFIPERLKTKTFPLFQILKASDMSIEQQNSEPYTFIL
jgi:hypothetical protein